MTLQKQNIIKAGLDTLYFSKLYRMFEAKWAGMGAIFMLHHVRERREPFAGFHPNGCLETTPEFLDAVLTRLAEQGVEFVSLDEAVDRIERGDSDRRFAAFTLDDGYLDNFTNARPIFAKHKCPFTVYVATKIIDGEAELWWLALEAVIARNDRVSACIDREIRDFSCSTAAEKTAAYETVYWHLRGLPEHDQRRMVRNLSARYGVSLKAICRAEAMSWDQVRELADDPLVTIGAHTVNHPALAKLDRNEARVEMAMSRGRLENELERDVEHFCYPYGDAGSAGAREFELAREIGFRSGVTTRKGLIYEPHRDHLHALPRVSLNGHYESLRYIDLYLSGAPFAFWNGFRRVAAA